MNDWIEIFKAGTHTDSAGNVSSWTEDDLDAVVERYNNQPEGERHEAPIVIGHPVTDSPAYGWVESLKREGDKLYAMPKQVDAGFATLVVQGSFKKRSAAFYTDKLLRHVGFLGAVPPAVKGMEDVRPVASNFTERRAGAMAFSEFAGETPEAPAESPVTAPDALIEAIARAAKYGVAVKSVQGIESEGRRNNVPVPEPAAPVKPGIYADLTDAQFGDPVNYLFPLHSKAAVLVSVRTFGSWEYRQLYTPQEYQAIAIRIVEAGIAQGLTEEERSGWYFVEVPPEMLHKKQLVQLIKNQPGQPITPTPNQTPQSTTLEESDMDPRTAFLVALAAFVSETFGAEAASQIEAKGNELIAATPFEAGTAAAEGETPAEGQHAESPEVIKLKAEVAALQKKNRDNDHNAFCEQLLADGKLTPANKPAVLALLEQTAIAGGELTFAENGKSVKQPTAQLFKHLLTNLPVAVSFGEQASGNRVFSGANAPDNSGEFSEESSALHKQIVARQAKYVAEHGKPLDYETALNFVEKGI